MIELNANTVCFRYLYISIPIIVPDLIFVQYGTFTTSGILCCTNTFGRLVYSPVVYFVVKLFLLHRGI